MSVATLCAHCQKRLIVAEGAIGKKVKCPGCQNIFVAQAAANGKPSAPPPAAAPRKSTSTVRTACTPASSNAAKFTPAPASRPSRQWLLRIPVVLIALLGTASAAFLAAVLYLAVLPDLERTQRQNESVADFAQLMGADRSVIAKGREEITKMTMATYIIAGAVLLGLLCSVVAILGRGFVPGLWVLSTVGAAGLLAPKSLILTSPLILAGLLSLLIRSPSGRRRGVVGWLATAVGCLLTLPILGLGATVFIKPGWFAMASTPIAANRPSSSSDPSGTVKSAPASTADFTLSAQELFDEYKKDEKAAHAKYEGKTLEVTGVVESCKASFPDSILNFEVKKGKYDLGGAGCITAEKECWARHGRGQKVTMRGLWGGKAYMGAALVKAVVVKADPNPTVLVKAEQLAKDFEADDFALTDRWDGKDMIVEGEVIKKDKTNVNFQKVILKGTDKTPVVCSFDFHSRELADPLMVGQKVTICGRFSEFYTYNEKAPALDSCLPVTVETTAQPPGPPAPLDPYRNTIKDASGASALIDKAGGDVKLATMEFKLGGVECTMLLPQGSRINASGNDVEIKYGPEFGEQFRLYLSVGKANLAELRPQWARRGHLVWN